MDVKHRELLVLFIVRMGMFIPSCSRDTITSFVHGFSEAAQDDNAFIGLLKERLKTRYRMTYSNLGWPQMVEDVARKWDMTFVNAFKRIALEILVTDRETLSEEIINILKGQVTGYVQRIKEEGDIWMTPERAKDWQWFVFISYPWFKALWPPQIWKVIKKIDKEIKDGNIFLHNGRSLPAPTLLQLRKEFDALK